MSTGSEKKQSILPTASPAMGMFGPDYSINDSIPTPAEIGVKRGSSMKDTINAAKGMAYYIDTIGFGESSTNFSRGLSRPVEKFGVNYFMPTGARCSNGADMWMYVETIPKGDALGKNAERAMKELGMPALRGLAPGIIEDAKSALDPRPIFSAVFGSGYHKCELVEKQVGDPRGRIQSPEGKPWVYDPQTVVIRNGIPYQQKWVQAKSPTGEDILLTRDQYLAEPKTHNRDGTPIEQVKEKFTNQTKLDTVSLSVAIALFAIAYSIHRK
jgi:hypothetical protein